MPKYIDADYIINAIGAEDGCGKCKQGFLDCRAHSFSRMDICNIVEDAPSINVSRIIYETATVEGYPVKDIICFASVCRAAGIPNEKIKDFINDSKAIYDTIYADIHRSIVNSLRIGLHEVDDAEIH